MIDPKPKVSPNSMGIPYTGVPPVMYRARPKPTEAMPRLIMNGETLNSATPTPLTTPIAAPAAIPATMPISIDRPAASGMAA